ncbi:MAG: hypothetical protein ABGY11_07485 [Candidatus Thioglobus sp.]|jgi:hypothetical protein
MIDTKKVIKYYASFYEVSKELNHKQFYDFNTAIFSVLFYEQHIDDVSFDDRILSITWKSIKHSLQASIDGFCNKNGIDYSDTLSKGLSKGVGKGLSKGLTNNVKEKEKEKDKEKGNKLFEKFWINYPKKTDKKRACISFNKLSKPKQEIATKDCIVRYSDTEVKYIPNPTTYLNGERWEDEQSDLQQQTKIHYQT